MGAHEVFFHRPLSSSNTPTSIAELKRIRKDTGRLEFFLWSIIIIKVKQRNSQNPVFT